MNLDISIFRALNSFVGRSAFNDWLFVFEAQYLPYIVGSFVVLLWLVWKKPWAGKMKVAFIFIAAGIISYLFIYLIFHPLWPRVRPFEALSGVYQLIGETGFSFPSKHALFSFLLASFVFGINRRVGWWFLVMAILISLGRVFVGVHYPLDVLVGAIFGVVMGLVAIFLAKKFRIL